MYLQIQFLDQALLRLMVDPGIDVVIKQLDLITCTKWVVVVTDRAN